MTPRAPYRRPAVSRRPTLRPIALVPLAALAACGYQPSLLGGADPQDATVPGSAWTVVYSAHCLRRCEISYTRNRDVHAEEVEGAWQARVRIAQGSRGSVMLTVRPVDDLGLVQRAGIDVDGRRAARGEGGPGSPVMLSAELAGRPGG